MSLLGVLAIFSVWMMANGRPAGQPDVIWKNLGRSECINLRGHYETCGYLQFCSESHLDRGCRNCTEISESWCSDDPVEFGKKYPSCEILCENKEMEDLKAENANMAENNNISLGILIPLLVLFVLGFIIAVFRYIRLRQQQRATVDSPVYGTASIHGESMGWRRVFSYFFGPSRPPPTQPAAPEMNDHESESFITQASPSSATNRPCDSGRGGSRSQMTTSNETFSDAVAPGVGTQHHPTDTKDFMQTTAGADGNTMV